MRKNSFWKSGMAVIAAALLLCLLACTALAESFPFAGVTKSQTNVRRSPSSAAAVVDRLAGGESVIVTGASGNYYKIDYGGGSGYVFKIYVEQTYGVTLETETTAVSYPYTAQTNDKVFLRKAASTSSRKLATVPRGASVTVLGLSGSFAHVKYQGKTGYIMSTYVNLKEIVEFTLPPATPTPVPTLDPISIASSYQILQRGSSGAGVKALQSALTELGFFSGAIDSMFGDSLYTAVVAFQSRNSYPATGVMDANLQAFLYSGTVVNSRGTKTKVNTLAPIRGAVITLGKKGDAVVELQHQLTILGYYKGKDSGTYDSATRKAVIAFQKANNLTANGTVDTATWDAIFAGIETPAPVVTAQPTSIATLVPVLQRPTGPVKSGSTGGNALMVQQRLKELGYYTDNVDGKFGPASVRALTAFQQNNNLTADGVAGDSTYDVLFSWSARSADTTPTPAPIATLPPAVTATPYAVTPESYVTVRFGTTGEAVEALQRRLTELGYYNASVDGICKAADVVAIRSFQQTNRLKVDGVAGYDTQLRLYSDAAIRYGETAETSSYTTLRTGATGAAVMRLQQRLIELGYLNGMADGQYGTATYRAVRAFQRANGLSVDGAAGPQTQMILFSNAAVSAPSKATATPQPTAVSRVTPTGKPAATQKPTATPRPTATHRPTPTYWVTPTPRPTATQRASATQQSTVIVFTTPKATAATGYSTVRMGDQSNSVKTLQQRLIDLGYLTSRADGKFGTLTYKALVAFQKNNRLTTDGVAGQRTWAALTSSSAVAAKATATVKPTAIPTAAPTQAARATATPAATSRSTTGTPRAADVIYANWYTSIKAEAKIYQYATVYDFSTGISWQVHMFSFGAHADAEPLTAEDTARMERAFGGNTWNPKAVWVVFGNGKTYMASTHSMPHQVQHITTNNFPGHMCIHFPRTEAQVSAIGPYATSHQETIDKGWATTQAMK